RHLPRLAVRGLHHRPHARGGRRELAAPCAAPAGLRADPPAARQRAVLARMTDAPAYIRLEVDGAVATLVLDRPEKLNAWSWESARQIAAHADALRFRDDVRVVVVRAEGRSFCAGVDLGMPEDRITGRSPAEKTRNYYERFRWVHERFHVLS